MKFDVVLTIVVTSPEQQQVLQNAVDLNYPNGTQHSLSSALPGETLFLGEIETEIASRQWRLAKDALTLELQLRLKEPPREISSASQAV